MIGNDIVDLKLAAKHSNWRRRRFLEKIFTEKEQQIILSVAYPEKYTWLLWSMKEAAYKAHQRCFNLEPRYNPQAFECSLLYKDSSMLCKLNGRVKISNEFYSCQTELNDDYVHTVTKRIEKNEIIQEVVSPQELRQKCTARFCHNKNVPRGEMGIKKDEKGIPYFFWREKRLEIPVSLSHHGKFAAYVF